MIRLVKNIARLVTPCGRAYFVLLKTNCFAVGPIGPAAVISLPERALLRLLNKRSALDYSLELTEQATLAGKLYAILGLRQIGNPRSKELIEQYQDRADLIKTRSCCFSSESPVGEIIAEIKAGYYSLELDVRRVRFSPSGPA